MNTSTNATDTLKVLAVANAGAGLTLANIELGLKCILLVVSIGYAVKKWLDENKDRRERKAAARPAQNDRSAIKSVAVLFLAATLCFLCGGCTMSGRKSEKVTGKLDRVESALQEESRALTTGVVDVLSLAPTNRHTTVALDLARHDQQIEGLPMKRIDTAGLISGAKSVLDDLDRRYALQASLLKENSALRAELQDKERELVAMGKLYEAERNKNIVKRFWLWATGTLGTVGAIALCVMFPAAIPLLGQLIGWLVSRIPALAGAFGVVSVKAFDAVASGVGAVRSKLKEEQERRTLELVNTELLKATDAQHRKLIDHRRMVLAV